MCGNCYVSIRRPERSCRYAKSGVLLDFLSHLIQIDCSLLGIANAACSTPQHWNADQKEHRQEHELQPSDLRKIQLMHTHFHRITHERWRKREIENQRERELYWINEWKKLFVKMPTYWKWSIVRCADDEYIKNEQIHANRNIWYEQHTSWELLAMPTLCSFCNMLSQCKRCVGECMT